MSNTQVAAEKEFVRAKGIVASEISGEMVMMDVESGTYFALTGNGEFIWRKLETPTTVPELVAALEDEYDLGNQTDLEAGLHKLLTNLVERKLVTVVD